MLCGDGNIKLIDLGQACPALTVKQRIQGTPDFISPEQVKCEPVTIQTDVFNFGATLYWSLTGGKKLPTLYNIGKGDNNLLFDQTIPSPAEVNPRIPLPMSNLVMECIRTNPAKRPENMAELSRRLELMSIAAARNGSQAASG
jgi:serine/threonine-protein kinase